MKKHTAQGLTNRERRALVDIKKSRAVPAGLASRLQRLGLMKITDRDDAYRDEGAVGPVHNAIAFRPSFRRIQIACGRLTPKGLFVVSGC